MAADILDGRFELQALLGSGGMAAVYRAWDREGRRPCAVKVLADVLASDPEVCRRFRQEAAAAGALAHPRIVTVYGWGQDGLRQFIAMEYVGGGTLRERLQREGPLPEAEALRVAGEVADALVYAHERHVVHRDIKPHNILVTEDGHVKVADFGIALTLDGTAHTRTGTVMGSAPYVSPEQVRGETAGPASDLYALGIVLYEMLAGRPPFAGEAPVAVAYKHLHEKPRGLREAGADVSPATAALVDRLLAKAPHKRYASAAALAAELHGLAAEWGGDQARRRPLKAPRRRASKPGPGDAAAVMRQSAPHGDGWSARPAAGIDATLRVAPAPIVDATAQLAVPAAGMTVSPNGPVAASRTIESPVDVTTQLPVQGTSVPGKTSAFRGLPGSQEAVSDTARLRVRPQGPDRTIVAARIIILAVCLLFGLVFLAAGYRAAWTAAHVTTPNLVGRTVADAGRTVETLRLGVLVSGKRQDAKAPFGAVLAQNPAPGVAVAKGTVIDLIVSEGSGIVPDLGGQSVQSASAMLERVGLRLGRVNYAVAIQIEAGRIIYQYQPAGTRLQPNGAVDIVVSRGFPRFPFFSPAPPPDQGPEKGPHGRGPGPEQEHRG
jgi:eukaryotic-like serine/threonine-protein kinase